MSEAVVVPEKSVNADRYKNAIIILTVFTTVLAAALAALQVDASIREDVANRESQYLAVLATGELHRSGLVSTHEFNIFGDYLVNLQEGTVLELTALEQKQDGDTRGAQSTQQLAAVASARAEVGERFSIFYNDPRYAPETPDELPAAEQYIIDIQQPVNDIVALQNDASDEYRRWNAKADSYVTALTILAVAFFLFGLAQAVKDGRMRLAFMSFGLCVLAFSMIFTIFTMVS